MQQVIVYIFLHYGCGMSVNYCIDPLMPAGLKLTLCRHGNQLPEENIEKVTMVGSLASLRFVPG